MDDKIKLTLVTAGFDHLSNRLDLIEIRLQTMMYQTNTILSHIKNTEYKDELENTYIEIHKNIHRKFTNQPKILAEMLKTLEIQKSLFEKPVDDPGESHA